MSSSPQLSPVLAHQKGGINLRSDTESQIYNAATAAVRDCAEFYSKHSNLATPYPRIELEWDPRPLFRNMFFDADYAQCGGPIAVKPLKHTLRRIASEGRVAGPVMEDLQFTVAHEMFHHIQDVQELDTYRICIADIAKVALKGDLSMAAYYIRQYGNIAPCIDEAGAHAFALAYTLRGVTEPSRVKDSAVTNPSLAYEWRGKKWYKRESTVYEAAHAIYLGIRKQVTTRIGTVADCLADLSQKEGEAKDAREHGTAVSLLYLTLMLNDFDITRTFGFFNKGWHETAKALSLLFRNKPELKVESIRAAIPEVNLEGVCGSLSDPF